MKELLLVLGFFVRFFAGFLIRGLLSRSFLLIGLFFLIRVVLISGGRIIRDSHIGRSDGTEYTGFIHHATGLLIKIILQIEVNSTSKSGEDREYKHHGTGLGGLFVLYISLAETTSGLGETGRLSETGGLANRHSSSGLGGGCCRLCGSSYGNCSGRSRSGRRSRSRLGRSGRGRSAGGTQRYSRSGLGCTGSCRGARSAQRHSRCRLGSAGGRRSTGSAQRHSRSRLGSARSCGNRSGCTGGCRSRRGLNHGGRCSRSGRHRSAGCRRSG